MVCATTKARGVKEASVLNLGSLHADLPKPASQTGDPCYSPGADAQHDCGGRQCIYCIPWKAYRAAARLREGRVDL